MESAFAALPDIRARLSRGELPLVFLDFDGTLAHIADNPSLTRMSEGMIESIRRCAETFKTYIVSGRTLDDLYSRIPVPVEGLAGDHGVEWVLHGVRGSQPISSAAQKDITDVCALFHAFADIPGVIIEPKGSSVALHFRLVEKSKQSDLITRASASLTPILARGNIEILEQKTSLDVRPRGWHKGDFVGEIMRSAEQSNFAIYIGDDRTDEDVFAALRSNDIGIRVGVGETHATYLLEDVDAVAQFLSGLAADVDNR